MDKFVDARTTVFSLDINAATRTVPHEMNRGVC